MANAGHNSGVFESLRWMLADETRLLRLNRVRRGKLLPTFEAINHHGTSAWQNLLTRRVDIEHTTFWTVPATVRALNRSIHVSRANEIGSSPGKIVC